MISNGIARAKRLLIPVVATSALVVWPAAAQQAGRRGQLPVAYPQSGQAYPQPTAQDNLRAIATTLNARRAELFRKDDPAGVASVYTPDATYVELLPQLAVMEGRADIQRHFQDLLEAGAGRLAFTVTDAKVTPNGAMEVGGDYSVALRGGKKIAGHFFQILRQDGGTWKIAMHIFARPEPVTAVEARQYNIGG
ncbi:MAG: nuclear transport factor 2 family protein [Acetobacteraceae bacterium]|nr:nuclear transport factor 2 family protein [Acetobacteraceae bacterium]